jgi:hypothetical protein
LIDWNKSELFIPMNQNLEILSRNTSYFFENAESILEAEIHSENYAVWG